MTSSPPVEYLSREARLKRFGIDCADALEWRGWEPGGDYVKKLIVKNLAADVRRLKYRLPATKFFYMQFPQTIVLSPGMFATITVNFRPIKQEEYFDFVEFQLLDDTQSAADPSAGRFRIPVRALLPEMKVAVPEQIDFGFVTVGETSELSASIVNSGEVPVTFKWSVPAEFEILPAAGSVPPGHTAPLAVRALIHSAAVREVVAACSCVAPQNGKQQTFHLSLRAVSKYPHLSVSATDLSFGEVLVGQSSQRELVIENTGTVPTTVYVQRMRRLEGSLEGAASQLQLEREAEQGLIDLPEDAVVELAAGTLSTRKAPNRSYLAAALSNFQFFPRSVRIPAHGRASVTFVFNARAPGVSAFQEFRLVTAADCGPGAPRLSQRLVGSSASAAAAVLACRAVSSSPSLTISTRTLFFGDVELGRRVTRVVTIQNNVNTPVRVQPLHTAYTNRKLADSTAASSSSGSFLLDVSPFEVPPLLSVQFPITFAPRHPMNYFKRLVLLPEGAQTPLYVDLVGTSFDDARRPAPLLMRHVSSYLSQTPADPSAKDQPQPSVSTEELLQEHNLAQGFFPCLFSSRSEPGQHGRVLEQSRARAVGERGAERTGAVGRCTIEEQRVDFGMCSPFRGSEPRTVTVRNHSSAKMTCVWDAPEPSLKSSGPADPSRPESVFFVVPAVQDIAPGEAATFRVVFRPPTENAYYYQSLECYCWEKPNRSFRLVDDKSFLPPVCLSTLALGHTFASLEAYVPGAEFSESELVFPPCLPGAQSFQTVTLRNFNDTPLAFRFDPPVSSNGGPAPFAVLPDCGVIGPRGYAVLALQYCPGARHSLESRMDALFPPTPSGEEERDSARPTPVADTEHAATLRCRLNGSTNGADALTVTLRGCAAAPRLSLESKAPVHFPPTCVGMASRRAVVLFNASPLPTVFQFQLPEPASAADALSRREGTLSVQPQSGVLAGFEALSCEWRFAPKALSKYRLVAPCHFAAASLAEQARTAGIAATELTERKEGSVSLTVAGEGVSGNVEFVPAAVNLGVLQANSATRHHLTLKNTSNCAVRFSLRARTVEPADADSPRPLLQFDAAEGEMAAKSQQLVGFSLASPFVAEHAVRVECLLHFPGSDGADSEEAPQPVAVCDVSCVVWFPQPRITDARSEAALPEDAWALFSADSINKQLQTELPLGALGRCAAYPPSAPSAASEGLRFHCCRFPDSELGDEPQWVYLRLENTAALDVEWRLEAGEFNSNCLQDEPWADHEHPSDDSLRQGAVRDHHLFTFEPKQGRLSRDHPSAVIRFAYNPKFSGAYQLPVVLRVKNGVDVAMLLQSFTVDSLPPQLYLLPHQAQQQLADQPIDLAIGEAPTQSVTLRNRSAYPLRYRVDLQSLAAIRRDNFNFAVFQVSNPQGLIPARSECPLEVAFHPLEAMQYSVDLPIYTAPVLDGFDCESALQTSEPQIITLAARGLHPSRPAHGPADSPKSLGLIAPRVATRPSRALLQRPGELAQLSTDELSFGLVPLHGSTSRVFTLLNNRDMPVEFLWRDAVEGPAAVKVEPASGTLPAGGRVLTTVTVIAGSSPAVLSQHLFCELACAEEQRSASARLTARSPVAAAPSSTPDAREAVSIIKSGESYTVHHTGRGFRRVNRMQKKIVHAVPLPGSGVDDQDSMSPPTEPIPPAVPRSPHSPKTDRYGFSNTASERLAQRSSVVTYNSIARQLKVDSVAMNVPVEDILTSNRFEPGAQYGSSFTVTRATDRSVPFVNERGLTPAVVVNPHRELEAQLQARTGDVLSLRLSATVCTTSQLTTRGAAALPVLVPIAPEGLGSGDEAVTITRRGFSVSARKARQSAIESVASAVLGTVGDEAFLAQLMSSLTKAGSGPDSKPPSQGPSEAGQGKETQDVPLLSGPSQASKLQSFSHALIQSSLREVLQGLNDC